MPVANALPHKVATLWRCYFETRNTAFLVDQSDRPAPVGSPWGTFKVLVKFAGAVLGVPALVGATWSWFFPRGVGGASGWSRLAEAWRWATSPLQAAFQIDGAGAAEALQWTALGVAVCLIVLAGYAAARGRNREAAHLRVLKRAPVFQILAWMPLQIAALLPLVTFLTLTFLFRNWYAVLAPIFVVAGYPGLAIDWLAAMVLVSFGAYWLRVPLSGVFRERLREDGDVALNARDVLSAIARWPAQLFLETVDPGSRSEALVDTVDSQMAFFEMQRKGVQAGDEAGAFLERVLEDIDPPVPIRLHLVGHSFGGLVALNAARRLTTTMHSGDGPHRWIWTQQRNARIQSAKQVPHAEIRSLCLLEGAVASDWLRYEQNLLASVTGAVGCVFSGYDTANGFWYPAANNGRLAAGYVGLCDVGDQAHPWPTTTVGQDGSLAMVVKPPDVRGLPALAGRPAPFVLNVDASRLIYQGSAAAGGGHDDIFKDDVVNLVWALTAGL